ncbi:hypothetical protein [Loktanella sp. R86503]|uniref:hypothetical protein n=1 Tax=Loktanella sp. R86503 TaxID=3093847 RepID=UPI0036DCEC1D
MTEPDDAAPFGRAEALARVRELAGFYAALKATFLEQLDQIGGQSALPSKAHAAKLAELQATHVHLLKAEEQFIEKFGQGTDDADIDFDAIRDDIGRRLDRIRAAGTEGGVFSRAERAGPAGPAASV